MIRQLHCRIFWITCEGEPSEGKHKQCDPASLYLEYLCPKHSGLGLETLTVAVCGLDKCQIDLHEG